MLLDFQIGKILKINLKKAILVTKIFILKNLKLRIILSLGNRFLYDIKQKLPTKAGTE